MSQHPQLQCLMLTPFDDNRTTTIDAGAVGYVLKEVRGGILVDAIRRIANGQTLLDPHASAPVIGRLAIPRRRIPGLLR